MKDLTLHQKVLVSLTQDLCVSERGRSSKDSQSFSSIQQSPDGFPIPPFSLSASVFSLFPSLSQKPWACSSSAYFISWAAYHSGTPPSSQQRRTHTRIEVTEAWVHSHWLELESCSVGRREWANVKHSWPGWITRFLLQTCQRNPELKTGKHFPVLSQDFISM